MSYNTASIRELLQIVFNDEQLTIFCFDYFRPVHEQFAYGMGRLVKIQLLIEYCDKYEEFDKLLALVKNINSKQYDKFSSLIKNPLKTPVLDISTSRGQVEITFRGDFSDFAPELQSAAVGAAVGAVAGVLNIPPDQISVLQFQTGSMILQIEMPGEAVDRMIALYETGDPIIQDLGIEQVKIFYTIPSQTTVSISSRFHGKSQGDLPIPETVVSEETIFEGKVLDFSLRQTQLHSGAMVNREIVINNDAVVIVPITKNNEVRLVRQYRAAAEKWVIELPAGGLEPGEDPDRAAPRELLEETGDQAAHWHRLHGFFSAPGILTEFLHLYLATDLTPGPNNLEFDEYIEVLTVPWVEAISMIRRHDIEDAKTIAGLMAAGLHLGLIRSE